MKQSPAFLFDLDGTLVDTAPDLKTTVNTLLTRDGLAPLDDAVIRRLVGQGARNLIAAAFAEHGASLAPDRVETLYGEFLTDYASHIAAESRPYPGVVETLKRLQAEGVRMGVLTNKPHGNAMQLLRELHLTDFFATIVGQGKFPWMKPDARVFAAAATELGGGAVVMVGDSITDVKTARAAGAPVILVSYGYTPEPAATLGADRVLDDFRDVPSTGRSLLGIF